MSAHRCFVFAAVLATSAGPAVAQSPAPPAQPTHQVTTFAAPPVMDSRIFAHALLDQFEARAGGGGPDFHWDAQAWAGGDYDKLWLKSEGTVRNDGKLEDGTHELLYDRAITTFFDLQAGLRSDLDSETGRHWAALGIQGLAPYFFDVEATAYASSGGHFAARLKGSYDLLITQRLILQPEIEMNFYSRSDPGRGVGSGLADIDAGLRLRYEIARKFAPYVGVAYEGKFGQTANFARREGESTDAVRFVGGLHIWF